MVLLNLSPRPSGERGLQRCEYHLQHCPCFLERLDVIKAQHSKTLVLKVLGPLSIAKHIVEFEVLTSI